MIIFKPIFQLNKMPVNTNLLNKIRYTLYAPAYDWAAKILDTSRKKSLKQLDAQPGEKILIIGAGTGKDLDFLPLGCYITATDITPAMVKRIEKRNINVRHRLKAMVMDGQNLCFESNSFDKIILHLILAVIHDPVKTIKEAERVLKPGGKIAVYDKFVPKNHKLSATRKVANVFTNLFFSNITRNFEQINSHTSLKIISDEKADLGGMFRIIQLEK